MNSSSHSDFTRFIHTSRGDRVFLDVDLARIYGVTIKRLNQAVKRNRERFPGDFCFQLTTEEWSDLRSQIATATYGGRRYAPWVFNEHGALMAANVLSSERAIQMSVFLVRAFIKMRRALTDTTALNSKLQKLEKEITSRLDSHEKAIVEVMRQFFEILNPPAQADVPEPKREIGFHVKDKLVQSGSKSKRLR